MPEKKIIVFIVGIVALAVAVVIVLGIIRVLPFPFGYWDQDTVQAILSTVAYRCAVDYSASGGNENICTCTGYTEDCMRQAPEMFCTEFNPEDCPTSKLRPGQGVLDFRMGYGQTLEILSTPESDGSNFKYTFEPKGLGLSREMICSKSFNGGGPGCEIKGFLLPHEYSQTGILGPLGPGLQNTLVGNLANFFDRWIGVIGEPKFLLYYQKFDPSYSAVWTPGEKPNVMMTMAIGGVLNGVGGILNLGKAGFKTVGFAVKKGFAKVFSKVPFAKNFEWVMNAQRTALKQYASTQYKIAAQKVLGKNLFSKVAPAAAEDVASLKAGQTASKLFAKNIDEIKQAVARGMRQIMEGTYAGVGRGTGKNMDNVVDDFIRPLRGIVPDNQLDELKRGLQEMTSLRISNQEVALDYNKYTGKVLVKRANTVQMHAYADSATGSVARATDSSLMTGFRQSGSRIGRWVDGAPSAADKAQHQVAAGYLVEFKISLEQVAAGNPAIRRILQSLDLDRYIAKMTDQQFDDFMKAFLKFSDDVGVLEDGTSLILRGIVVDSIKTGKRGIVAGIKELPEKMRSLADDVVGRNGKLTKAFQLQQLDNSFAGGQKVGRELVKKLNIRTDDVLRLKTPAGKQVRESMVHALDETLQERAMLKLGVDEGILGQEVLDGFDNAFAQLPDYVGSLDVSPAVKDFLDSNARSLAKRAYFWPQDPDKPAPAPLTKIKSTEQSRTQ